MPGKEITDTQAQELVDESFEAMKQAYCPYSKFPVGAALLCEDGTVFRGCNVENASYSLCICAERTAISQAVSQGRRTFKAIAVCSTLKDSFITPCGACRQFLAEFGLDWDVYITKSDRSYERKTVRELLPLGFTPSHLLTEHQHILGSVESAPSKETVTNGVAQNSAVFTNGVAN